MYKTKSEVVVTPKGVIRSGFFCNLTSKRHAVGYYSYT